MKQDRVRTDVLDIAYEEHGPSNGPPVILLHGFPYDVACLRRGRAAARGRGLPRARALPARLRADALPDRSDAALGRAGGTGPRSAGVHGCAGIRRAVLAGYDWGGRAACVVAALWPERVRGLVALHRLQHLQHRRLAEARPRRSRSIATGTSTTSIPSAGGPAWPGTGATSAICCGQLWSPELAFDEATFEKRRGRSTIPTSSTS